MEKSERLMNMFGINNFIGFDKYKLAGAYHWNSINTNKEYIDQSNTIINQVVLGKYKNILDIGCGDAAIAGKLGQLLPNSKIYGFDAEPSAIECGTKKLKEYNISNVFLSNITIGEAKQQYCDLKFDFCYSLDVIEHLPNPHELVDFIKNINLNNCIIGTPLFVGEEYVSEYHVKEYQIEELHSIFGRENIVNEWILSGNRKSKKSKRFFEQSYYLCHLSF